MTQLRIQLIAMNRYVDTLLLMALNSIDFMICCVLLEVGIGTKVLYIFYVFIIVHQNMVLFLNCILRYQLADPQETIPCNLSFCLLSLNELIFQPKDIKQKYQ